MEKFYHLAVGEIVRLHDGHLVARHDVASHGKEQRSLGSRRENNILCRIDGGPCKRRQMTGHMLQNCLSSSIGRICLRSTLLHACLKDLKASRRGNMSIHVSMGKIHRIPVDFLPAKLKLHRLLKALLARSIVDSKPCESFFQCHIITLLLCIFTCIKSIKSIASRVFYRPIDRATYDYVKIGI